MLWPLVSTSWAMSDNLDWSYEPVVEAVSICML